MTRWMVFLWRKAAELRSWMRAFTHRRRLEDEMDAELAEHLAQLTEDLIRAGHAPADAARRARIAMGSMLMHKEEMRASLGLRWFDELGADLRYAARLLRKSPGFTAIAVTSLALAIGANTAIFSVAKEILYDRLGVSHSEQLRLLGWTSKGKSPVHSWWSSFNAEAAGMTTECFSYPAFRELAARSGQLIDVFAFKDFTENGAVRGNPQRIDLELVSGNYYGALGVRPQLGRAIQTSDDGAAGTGAVAVISDGFWRREFGGSPTVLGQTIQVEQTTLTIVGVNPRSFTGAAHVEQSPDVFVPLSMQPLVAPMPGKDSSLLGQANNWWLEVMGRVKPGVSDNTVRTSLDVALAEAVRGTLTVAADEKIPQMVVVDGSRGLHQTDFMLKAPLIILQVMVGLVLLLSCANVANLLLARGAGRQREMSVRLALGAGRGRLLRLLLTESLLLAALGGAGGLLFGYFGRNGLPALLPSEVATHPIDIRFDWGVFGFVVLLTLLTGLAFGLAPAWAAARSEVSSSLKESAQTATRRRKVLGGKALVAFQVALSTLLVIAAGLFARTLLGLNSIDPGFKTDHLLLVDINFPNRKYADGERFTTLQRIDQAIAAVPGVQNGSAMSMPYISGMMMTTSMATEEEIDAHSKTQDERMMEVGNRFFETLGIPIVAGRGFNAQDTPTSPKVAVINQALARERFPHGNPVGQRFSLDGGTKDLIQVVGVCGNTSYQNLRETPPPQFFLPYAQRPEIDGFTYAIRTQMKPDAVAPALRKAVQKIDRNITVLNVRTQQQQIAETMSMEHVLAWLTAGFGVLALALACIGIYGIMAYSVAQRTNEIGIRLALGAQPGQICRMILRESTWLAAAGLLVGLGGALALARLVKSMLYGVAPYDPVTLGGAVVLLLGVALVASWIPARRAAGVQPMEALRHE